MLLIKLKWRYAYSVHQRCVRCTNAPMPCQEKVYLDNILSLTLRYNYRLLLHAYFYRETSHSGKQHQLTWINFFLREKHCSIEICSLMFLAFLRNRKLFYSIGPWSCSLFLPLDNKEIERLNVTGNVVSKAAATTKDVNKNDLKGM